MTRLPLRLRIFLFFGLLAAGAIALVGVAMGWVWTRADPTLPANPFITAAVIFAFLNTGLILGIWLLFDEHVARPIERLSVNLRLRAHADVDAQPPEARYLGDLAPAARALTQTVDASVEVIATTVARETDQLRQDHERLTALLSESPLATILINPAQEIVLYDAQAATVMDSIAPPRLKAPLADYFDLAPLNDIRARANPKGLSPPFPLRDVQANRVFTARHKGLGQDGDILFLDTTAAVTDAAPRPLVFDFDLLDSPSGPDMADTPLSRLSMVVFDTETTGLSVAKDAIVQIAAQRILNGRIIGGEVFDTLVHPGRPIPPAASRIHRITDADVAQAPGIDTVAPAFHAFARGAVLVAHNAPFDLGFLHQSAGQLDLSWDHPVLDTVLLSAVVFGTTADHTLDALCARLSNTIPDADRHTALGDAKATAAAVVKLIPLLEGKGITTFGDLLTETRKHGRLLQDLNTS